MGRTKKIADAPEITPSKYQEAIFDFIEHGNGNLLIEANAGCGKTTTMVKAISLIDKDKKILFCAFNNEIVKDIEKKVKGWENVTVSTVHSLGFTMLKNNFRDLTIVLDEFKYKKELINNLKDEYSSINTYLLGKKTYNQYFQNILRLIDLMRYNLAATKKDSIEIIQRYDLNIVADEVDVAIKLMDWGKRNFQTVDYTDMVWLPNVLYLKPIGCQFDFIFGDECQDFSAVQRELLLKCYKINTRFIFCGDQNQSIYGFSSADINSFKKLKELPNMHSLPLPISYRCASKIVNFAKTIVPTIEENNDGRIGDIEFKCSMSNVQDGDMILCRNNAPLMKIYNDYIKMGKKCYIRGRDFGSNLKKLVDDTNMEDLNQDLTKDGVFVRLYDSLFELRDKIAKQEKIEIKDAEQTESFNNRLDAIRTLDILSNDINTATELKSKIDGIFSDKTKEGIMLSTVHKAKGLESNRVFIACESLMPSKSARLPWEKIQETNLRYVAFTRAKNFLGFLDETEFKLFINDNVQESLNLIEYKVNTLLGKKRSKEMTFAHVQENIKKNERIEKPNYNNVVQGLQNHSITQPIRRNLNDIAKKKLNRFNFFIK